MTRIAKLYRKLLDGRPLSFSEFERLLVAFGYQPVRQKGSHRAWRHPGIADTRIIQPKGKSAKPYQVDQFLDIVEKHALTLDDDANDEPLSH
jgi:predicted RNA binding protein YcfA (HicA-like mRNA interferase family)